MVAMQHKDYRLAAILYTDIVGFSRMMGEDEAKTLALLEIHNGIIESVVAKNSGTVIKTIGDAYMIDFRNTVFALQSAIDIQEKLYEYNVSHDDAKLLIRIGIHLGDIYFYENDAFGEGINIAARLQSFAKPGCICFSQDVFNQVLNKIDFHAEKLGKISLKNITKEIRGYEIESKNVVFDTEAASRRAHLIDEAVEKENITPSHISPSPDNSETPLEQTVGADEESWTFDVDGKKLGEDIGRATQNIASLAEKKLSSFFKKIDTEIHQTINQDEAEKISTHEEQWQNWVHKKEQKGGTAHAQNEVKPQPTQNAATNMQEGAFSFEHIRIKCIQEYEAAYAGLTAHLIVFVIINIALWYVNGRFVLMFPAAPIITLSWAIGLISNLLYVKSLNKRRKEIEKIAPLTHEAWLCIHAFT